MKNLFGDNNYIEQKGKIDFDDYERFVEKFKPKKTTDDCYTPPEIYSAILEYVKDKCDLSGKRILRPFVPGGDYQAIRYGGNDVVIDNPPFSILSSIINYYLAHNVQFFLFAPTLTLLSATKMRCTSIVCNASIVYENGAVVNTSFATNLYGDDALIVDGELHKRIEAVSKRLRKELPKTLKRKEWPNNVTSSALLSKIAIRTTCSMTIPASNTRWWSSWKMLASVIGSAMPAEVSCKAQGRSSAIAPSGRPSARNWVSSAARLHRSTTTPSSRPSSLRY